MKPWMFVVLVGAITALLGIYTTIMGPFGPIGPWYITWPHPPYQPAWAGIGILLILAGLYMRRKAK